MLPMADAARLAEIDRELDSFDKNQDVLRDVVGRAVADSPRGLEAADAVLEGLGAPLDSGSFAAHTRDEVSRQPIESLVPTGMTARPAEFDEPVEPREIPEEASGLVELPENVIRETEMPAVLALGQGAESAPNDEAAHPFEAGELASENTDIRHADQLADSDLFGDAASPDLGGGTLDDLFDDVPRPSSPDGFADPFFEEPATGEAALRDIGDDLGSLPDEPEHTALFSAAEIQAIRSSGPPPPKAPPEERALDAQLDALVSEPMSDVVEPDELPPSGEFELLVDEDVLVIDDADVVSDSELIMPQTPSSAAPPPPLPSSAPPAEEGEEGDKKGFFSRILNRGK